jgi:hypothetical protein
VGSLLSKEPRAMQTQSRIILNALSAEGAPELTPEPDKAAADTGKTVDVMV